MRISLWSPAGAGARPDRVTARAHAPAASGAVRASGAHHPGPVRFLLWVLPLGLVLSASGCKDLTGSPGLPAGTPTPSFYYTPAGAIGMRAAALFAFQQAIAGYILDAGLLTDELGDPTVGTVSPGEQLANAGSINDPLDERILPEGSATDPVGATTGGVGDYGQLQGVREFGNQAIGALATYDTIAADTATSKWERGEVYALEGYAEIMLADFFCSGVPLSTLDFQKDYTYLPGSTTIQVYEAAVAKLDTALTLADTNTQVLNLARVGLGRAFLDLGQYDSAAVAVAHVPEGFAYQDSSSVGVDHCGPGGSLICVAFKVSDREGTNGLPYLSSGDPRTALEVSGNDTAQFPAKYGNVLTNNEAAITVADWIEARLIQAEAAYNGVATGQGSWLVQLNALRQTAPIPGTSSPQPTLLPPLTDPGTDSGRVALLFQERAEWLFMTGHRQGDLRRLLRNYTQIPAFRLQQRLYPVGRYLGLGGSTFGSDITVPIPVTEFNNPFYGGCLSRAP